MYIERIWTGKKCAHLKLSFSFLVSVYSIFSNIYLSFSILILFAFPDKSQQHFTPTVYFFYKCSSKPFIIHRIGIKLSSFCAMNDIHDLMWYAGGSKEINTEPRTNQSDTESWKRRTKRKRKTRAVIKLQLKKSWKELYIIKAAINLRRYNRYQ